LFVRDNNNPVFVTPVSLPRFDGLETKYKVGLYDKDNGDTFDPDNDCVGAAIFLLNEFVTSGEAAKTMPLLKTDLKTPVGKSTVTIRLSAMDEYKDSANALPITDIIKAEKIRLTVTSKGLPIDSSAVIGRRLFAGVGKTIYCSDVGKGPTVTYGRTVLIDTPPKTGREEDEDAELRFSVYKCTDEENGANSIDERGEKEAAEDLVGVVRVSVKRLVNAKNMTLDLPLRDDKGNPAAGGGVLVISAKEQLVGTEETFDIAIECANLKVPPQAERRDIIRRE
jgi:hypothetical protein